MHSHIDPSLLAGGTFSPHEIKAFRRVYHERHGILLNDDQATRYARALVAYVALVCRAGDGTEQGTSNAGEGETQSDRLDEDTRKFN